MNFFIPSILFTPLLTLAYIPKTATILQRLAENNGNGAYQIEQEVSFPSESDTLILKETWIVDSDLKMRLVVQGTKDLRDQLKWVFVYDGSRRYQNAGGNRLQKNLDENFIEKYFHLRKSEEFARIFIRLGILDERSVEKTLYRSTKDVDYRPDPLVRLSRTNGVVTYALGRPSPEEGAPTPGAWIEQDLFLLRKLRLPAQAEISADKYSSYSRSLSFPKVRTVKWGNHQVEIHTFSVSGREKNPSLFNPAQIEQSTRLDLLPDGSTKNLIEDFYKRFR
ncbi:MAG: hypothetical protein BroJett040_10440 [Oligoflexia bacterium]|nr:MAG: hypothetical protein BroJett040_10440 [Oligoflexia bacterium]